MLMSTCRHLSAAENESSESGLDSCLGEYKFYEMTLPCIVLVVVTVARGLTVVLATTETVRVVCGMDKQLHALESVRPEGYALSADGLGTGEVACLLLFWAASHVLPVTVEMPSVTVVVTVVVLSQS